MRPQLVEAVVRMFCADFTYGFYVQLLRWFGERFGLHPLQDFDHSAEPRTYLRHDIDISIDAALPMAEMEAEHGFRTTYMLIPTSPLYSLAGEKIRRIADLGHEIAIHFDYLTSGVEPDHSMEPEIHRQCDVIAQITGQPIRSISFHRPTAQFLRGPDHLLGMVNANSSTLMQWYRSDSGGRWRSNPMDEMPDNNVAQLLTHPIWWGEQHQTPLERLAALDADPRVLAETVPRAYESLA